jgi:hypothetical protein
MHKIDTFDLDRPHKDVEILRSLGSNADGYSYHLGDDRYVYQKCPNGKWNGWICSFPTWYAFQNALLD